MTKEEKLEWNQFLKEEKLKKDNKDIGLVQSTKLDELFVPKVRWDKINESQKVMDIVPGFPVNKRMPYNRQKMIKAIQYGMIVLFYYKGEDEKKAGGQGGERAIYPMVLGVNRNTKNELIRGWHLLGHSFSGGAGTEKVWRLFKSDNIDYMMFVGNFYRLGPKGYKMNDRVMTERTIQRADFNTIRRNQNRLIQANKIESEKVTTIGEKGQAIVNKIEIKNTGTQLDLKKIYDNELIEKKNIDQVKVSFMKTVFNNEWLVIIGAIGAEGKSVKVYEEKKLLGTYKTVKAVRGKELLKTKNVKGQQEFDVYSFIKKL